MKWLFLFPLHLMAVVRILTFHCNQPDFIELQYNALKKFLRDDFEYIVFNDAKSDKEAEEIDAICSKCRVKCVRFHPDWHLLDPLNGYLQTQLANTANKNTIWSWADFTSIENISKHPSVRHSHVIQFALDGFGYSHDDLVVLMDGDCFLIKPTSFRELLGTNHFAGCSKNYDIGAVYRRQFLSAPTPSPGHSWLPWVVFIAFNPNHLKDIKNLHFNVDIIHDHPNYPQNSLGDTGAAACKYLLDHPDLNIKEFYSLNSADLMTKFSSNELTDLGFEPHVIRLMEDIKPASIDFFAHEHFLHFGSVSFASEEDRKVVVFKKFMEKLTASPKVYDCFLFMNELEVLDIRLHEMDPVVDHFVIVEATETFRGNPKELTFAENLDRFAKFKNKIIHYIIDFHYETNNPWDRETFHRNSIIHALGCCEDEDIILISDVDEIVKAEGVKNIYQQLSQNPSQILGTSQKYHCYYLNSTPDPVIWRGTVATTYGALRKTTCQGVRDLRYLVPSAATGWHFTYQGGIERELYKISAFSHSELDTPEQKEKRKRDHLLGNRYSFIEIDESYPAYIRTNRAYFESIGFIRF